MKKYLIIILFVFITFDILADSWLPPSTKTYYSENKEYMLRVFPTKIPDKYWDWESSSKRKKKRFEAKDTTIIKCHAILYKLDSQDSIQVWNKFLINRTAPSDVIVANDGSSIATFDNWHSLGYGIVFTIYNEKGEVENNYKLEDFSPYEIDDYMHSVSSIWWKCGAKYIDINRIEICCSVEEESKDIHYNLKSKEFE